MYRSIIVGLALLFSGSAYAQFQIKGTVTNEEGVPLDGASIFLRLTDIATISNERGRYVLDSIPEGEYELKCTYLGYSVYTDFYYVDSNIDLDIILEGTIYNIDEVEIQGNRLASTDPFSFKTVDKEDIIMDNLAQDVPFILKNLPSTVVTSDAGAGVGYTGIRIRGSDPTRVNVTINGVPLNDSESQGVFWVNLPDFASSVTDIQVQRGVGTSTNGVGAFGATVGLNTHDIRHDNFVEATLGYGSFNTSKLSVQAGTGLMNDVFSVSGRFSIINSDGYIDRASSNLRSWMISAAKVGNNSSLRLDIFSGNEVTYQSWWGAPEARVTGDQDGLLSHYFANKGFTYLTAQDSINLFDNDRRYNYYTYDNQVDDYQQDHYQLHYSRSFSDKFTAKATLHYTHGFGFFEEYRTQDDMRFYKLYPFVASGDTLEFADLVRRRWLDNDFFGVILNNSLQINERHKAEFGGSLSYYRGEHFGEVIDIILANANDKFPPYYLNIGRKFDQQFYIKVTGNLSQRLLYFADLQLRGIDYTIEGTENDILLDGNGNREFVEISDNFFFINPKLGLSYLTDNSKYYVSAAVANKEPDRNDYINGYRQEQQVSHETLYDLELGMNTNLEKLTFAGNLYYMYYLNQLVLDGSLNDVGAPLKTNVDQSYRAGLELEASYMINPQIILGANTTLSQNKIAEFTEILYDGFTEEVIENTFTDTDIAFSPSVIANGFVRYSPVEALVFQWNNKYVGKQFMDNTSNDARSLDPFFVSDLGVQYTFDIPKMKSFRLNAKVHNLFNNLYSANGYTYSYLWDGFLTTENFLYPQAGTYFMINLTAGI